MTYMTGLSLRVDPRFFTCPSELSSEDKTLFPPFSLSPKKDAQMVQIKMINVSAGFSNFYTNNQCVKHNYALQKLYYCNKS